MGSISETAIHQAIVNEAFRRLKRTLPESFGRSALIPGVMTRDKGPDDKCYLNTGFNPFMIWHKYFYYSIIPERLCRNPRVGSICHFERSEESFYTKRL